MKYESAEYVVTTSSRIFRKDAERVVDYGRAFLACLGKDWAELNLEVEERFGEFRAALYSAGFVMTDFNGPLFSRGPLQYILDPDIARQVAERSNLLTIRMHLHTLVRAHAASDQGIGFPWFDEAFSSGGLPALIERLDSLCHRAKAEDRMELDVLED